MHYLLIQHGETGDPAHVVVCDTEAERDRATLAAIYGKAEDADPEAAKHDLAQLRDDGWLRFEGDPPLQWVKVGSMENTDLHYLDSDSVVTGERAASLLDDERQNHQRTRDELATEKADHADTQRKWNEALDTGLKVVKERDAYQQALSDLLGQIGAMKARSEKFQREAEADADVHNAAEHQRVFCVLKELERLGQVFQERANSQ